MFEFFEDNHYQNKAKSKKKEKNTKNSNFDKNELNRSLNTNLEEDDDEIDINKNLIYFCSNSQRFNLAENEKIAFENKDITNLDKCNKFVNFSTNILEKLAKIDNYNTIVLNLYPFQHGYSIGLNIKINELKSSESKIHSGDLLVLNKIETKLLSYEENEFLFYVNSCEIPPVLIDIIDRLNVNLYYDGNIIMEVRDYRRILDNNNITNIDSINKNLFDLHYILLHPTTETLLADINSITNDGNFIWTQEDKYYLESQLLLATKNPLCLNPNPSTSLVKNKINLHKQKFSNRKLKRLVKKHSDSCLNFSKKWKEFNMPFPFKILKIRKFFQESKQHFQSKALKHEGSTLPDIKSFNVKNNLNNFTDIIPEFMNVDNWTKIQPIFKLPNDDMILVKKFAKPFECTNYTLEPVLNSVKEIILEAIDKTSKNSFSKLLIKRRSNDGTYFCQFTSRNETETSAQSLFPLGLAHEAEKYICQYIEIFTEEGRRPVTIKQNLIERINKQEILTNDLCDSSDSLKPNNKDESLKFENNQKYSMDENIIFNGFFSETSYQKNSSILFSAPFNNYYKTLLDFNDKQLLHQNYLKQE